MSDPINKNKIRDILAEFMQDIEDWQSEIEGSPQKEDFATLDTIYNDTINELDKEYLR